MTIHFYSPAEPFGCFSNFSRHPVTLGGRQWPTTEHYFQAQKFAGTPHEGEVRRAQRPMLAARLGRSRARPLRKDWETVKDDLMRAAVEAKASYWGCGPDGKGRNQLGKILMEVREKLRAEAAAG